MIYLALDYIIYILIPNIYIYEIESLKLYTFYGLTSVLHIYICNNKDTVKLYNIVWAEMS